MNLPNQERCCDLCEGMDGYCTIPNCKCHTQNHEELYDAAYRHGGVEGVRYVKEHVTTQNHSTKDYQDLTDEEKKEMMLGLAREANKSQRDMVHSTMEGWEDKGITSFIVSFGEWVREMHPRDVAKMPDYKLFFKNFAKDIDAAIAKERESAERSSQFLFALLDDVDTADDIAKSDDKLYRELVRKAHKRRFEVATTDGYTVTFAARKDTDVTKEV